MPASTVSAKTPRGKPFRSGPDHPRYKRGKAAVPRLADGRSLYELFRCYTEDAARLLAAVMNDPNEDTDTRVRAAAIVLQRGWGDAPKQLHVAAITDSSRAVELSEAEIAALVSAAGGPLARGLRRSSVIDVSLPVQVAGTPDAANG